MGDNNSEKELSAKHRATMKARKEKVDAAIEKADSERGVSILLTGNGKGKSSSAFGMVTRSLGHGLKVGIVQFIKGTITSGEESYVRDHHPEVAFHQMATGFTWNTQDRESDIAAAEKAWRFAEEMLSHEDYHLVVLDEITYMLAYDYLEESKVLAAIKNRPLMQSVVLTGRGGGEALRDAVDTISELKDIKHAFRAGIKARIGIDY